MMITVIHNVCASDPLGNIKQNKLPYVTWADFASAFLLVLEQFSPQCNKRQTRDSARKMESKQFTAVARGLYMAVYHTISSG